MKAFKMWANTDDEAKSIVNYMKACGGSWGMGSSGYSAPEGEYTKGGYYLSSYQDNVITYSTRCDRDYYDMHELEEFTFATPVHVDEFSEFDFVEDKPHSHYFKDVSHLKVIDVYRVLELFEVTNPSIAHAAKKLLVAGGRGAGKDIAQDIQEAVDSLNRWKQMREEDNQW